MQMKVRKEKRISRDLLNKILHGERTDLLEELTLTAEIGTYWVTDQDLYETFMILANTKDITTRLAKILETITIIPAQSIGQERLPLSHEQLEKLRQVRP